MNHQRTQPTRTPNRLSTERGALLPPRSGGGYFHLREDRTVLADASLPECGPASTRFPVFNLTTFITTFARVLLTLADERATATGDTQSDKAALPAGFFLVECLQHDDHVTLPISFSLGKKGSS